MVAFVFNAVRSSGTVQCIFIVLSRFLEESVTLSLNLVGKFIDILFNQMSDGFNWGINQHSRSGKPHYLFHSFAHGGFITMDGTSSARCFLFSEGATAESCMGIRKQFAASVA